MKEDTKVMLLYILINCLIIVIFEGVCVYILINGG